MIANQNQQAEAALRSSTRSYHLGIWELGTSDMDPARKSGHSSMGAKNKMNVVILHEHIR